MYTMLVSMKSIVQNNNVYNAAVYKIYCAKQ